MPIMDGYEATRWIRMMERQDGRPPVPILAVTASALQEDKDKAFEAGMNDVLLKPYRQKAMLDKVRQWSGRKSGRVAA